MNAIKGTQRIYSLPVETTGWKFDGATEIAFNWEYDDGSAPLLELYEKGKTSQWNASTDIDWSPEAADTNAALPGLRQRAELPPCPSGTGAGPGTLRGITVPCAADGTDVDAARVVAGRVVLLNLWAYWCAPCRTELPAMAEYQQRAGPDVTVVTVHQDDQIGNVQNARKFFTAAARGTLPAVHHWSAGTRWPEQHHRTHITRGFLRHRLD